MASLSQNRDDAWKPAMDSAMPATVAIHSASPYPFDTMSRDCGESTGFVVDADRGIILTTRHVTGLGPFYGRAVFQGGARQCAITPCFVDEIHDFAFVRFDVRELQGLPLKAIELRPDLAEVGLEVRVLGNDLAQVMSILPGVVSRVDCNPPPFDSCKCPYSETLRPPTDRRRQ